MAGLLDLMAQFGATPEDLKDANKQAAFAMGFGLLAGKGNTLQNIGQAGMGAMAVRQRSLYDSQNMRQNSLQNAMGLQRLQQDMDEREARVGQQRQMSDLMQRSSVPGLPPMGPPTAQGEMQPEVLPSFNKKTFGAGLWNIDPSKAMAFEQAQARESPYAKINVKDYTPESVAAFSRSGNEADLRSAEADDIGKLNPSDYTPASMARFKMTRNYADLVGVDKRPQTNVSVKNFAETEYDKTIGKANAEAFVGYQTAGRNADAQINRLTQIDNLLRGVDTNAATPIGMKVSGAAKAIGITLDPNLPAKEAAAALTKELSLNSRQGGTMPGSLSDRDVEFLEAMNPNLAQTPEGRALLIDTRRKVAQREKKVAELARNYAKQNGGRLDSGFDTALSIWVNANPLFTGNEATLAPAAGPTVRFEDLNKRRR